MARIRTIKPEFWTDEKILECSLNGRLLFLGLLNFADDYGNIEGSPKVIKSRILPLDDIDIIPLLEELAENKLIQEYSKNDSKFFHINGFRLHQKIDKPGKPRCPLHEDSANVPRIVKESSGSPRPRKGREGRGGEGKGEVREVKDLSGKPDLVPQVISFLNTQSGRNFKITQNHTKFINARINEGFSLQDFETVIIKQVGKWKDDPKMAEFLRPSTLFSNKMDGYLNSPYADAIPEKEEKTAFRKRMDVGEKWLANSEQKEMEGENGQENFSAGDGNILDIGRGEGGGNGAGSLVQSPKEHEPRRLHGGGPSPDKE